MFQRAAVRRIRRDSGRPEAVVADRRHDAGRERALAHHAPGIDLGHRAEQKRPLVGRDAGGSDVGVQRLGQRVMAGHHVQLAAFLVQTDQPARALRLQVLHAHLQRGADAEIDTRRVAWVPFHRTPGYPILNLNPGGEAQCTRAFPNAAAALSDRRRTCYVYFA
jgi:hypothetical protein